jgi:hypothetical protein
MTIPLLLQKQRMVYSLQPQCNDFQVLVGQPETGHDLVKPCILLMTRSADQEIDELSLELAARNIAILRLDSDWCLGQEVCWDINRQTLITHQGTFCPILCWFRYFTSDSIQESGEAGIDKFVRSQWRAWSRSVLKSSKCRKINATVGTLEIDRISQLLQAKETGLPIPKTVATTRLDLAVSALGNPSKLLIKSIGDHYVEMRPGSLQGLFPVELDIKDLPSENELAPMIAQEFITGCREIKIFVIGLNFFAFSLIKKSINTEWSDFSNLQAEPISMIEELATPLLCLMRDWSLDIACFDFIDTGSGYVFLEVNTMCDWLWIEQKTGDSAVSVAVLNLLVDLFTQESTKFS